MIISHDKPFIVQISIMLSNIQDSISDPGPLLFFMRVNHIISRSNESDCYYDEDVSLQISSALLLV